MQGGKESYYYVNSTWKMYWREEIQTGLKSLFLIFWPVSIKIPNWSESNFFYVHLYTDIYYKKLGWVANQKGQYVEILRWKHTGVIPLPLMSFKFKQSVHPDPTEFPTKKVNA